MQHLQNALLAWFDQSHRILPWREDPSPWKVWVSEIMLQQTRVASVTPYFERFIARFPSPQALAEAPLDEVLGCWAGLGYYARARHLYAAAHEVVHRFDGQIPSDFQHFSALPGVGPYTAGAVASIAFGQRHPAVDGNVARVLCRVMALAKPPAQAKAPLHQMASALADGPRPGDVNQALMELGALICTPKSPRCLLCPLASACQARAQGLTDALPLKAAKAARPEHHFFAALAQDAERLWLIQQPSEGLLGGLWLLPQGESPAALLALGFEPQGEPLCQIRHVFTHQAWTLSVVRATPTASACGQAVPLAALDGLALGGPALKALRAAGLPLAHRRGAGKR